MNVMKVAHQNVKAMIKRYADKGIQNSFTYREMLKACLKVAHRKFKEILKMTNPKSNKLTVERQVEIYKEGQQAFQAQTSVNPYKEGKPEFKLFLEGWLEAKRNHYKNN